jgi:hypothetical protein
VRACAHDRLRAAREGSIAAAARRVVAVPLSPTRPAIAPQPAARLESLQNAQGGTRTLTPSRARASEARVSTNSTTCAAMCCPSGDKMRREGLEAPRPRGHGPLRPACLLAPPSARWSCSSLRLMRREGLEPSRPRGPGLLRPVCLPISPPARRSRDPHQKNAQGGIRTHTPSRARPSRGRLSASSSTCASFKF